MKEKILKDSLQQAFDFAIWQKILPLFFKKINYFSRPENLFTENDKVIDGKQIGTVKLDDGKQLAIFTVEVADSISIVRNRQGLREIAAKHIDQNIIHGALAFFYNKKQADYRFSFIAKEASIDLETGELIKGETKPKRYTYLLGSNEACTTPAKRMLVLADKKEKGEVNINQLKEVFSVEALNKDFFKTYKAHYEKFWKYLADEENPYRAKLIDAEKEDKVKQEKPIRDFAKKLLGRIVFLHFLQKKGWMGCSPKTKDWIDGEPRFMQQLFEEFSKPDNFQSQCLTHLFFETLNTKRPNDTFEVKGLNGKLNGSRVPYLNGGLFEPEKNKATLKIDFPADYFKELLEFFEQYNFTIDENSPDDHEVGIDPEMLGHIFENLLEDNRDKGAFYTPKEIVQYMCKESLIQYLLNTFQEQKDIEQFIRFHTVSPLLAEKENAILLNKKLDDIKVCDPAIGSGAFPIGMLQEIFEAKRFIYPYLKTNKDFKPAEVKKNIIQNSIYGVDLEKGAVDIAQLRFWLSLVVDELNPHPLPNLDYKIMQGNSLLETFQMIDLSQIGKLTDNVLMTEPERDLFGNLTDEQMKITFSQSGTSQKIQDLIKIFFTIEVSKEKQDIRQQINRLVLAHIEYNLKLREDQLHHWISEADNPKNLKTTAKKKYNGYVTDLNTLQNTKAQLLDIHETDERPYFLWHLYFMDVFEQGGFDVVIGNPPYIKEYKNKSVFDGFRESKYYQGKMDLWYGFACCTLDLLKENGIQSFIAQNNWVTSTGASKLREKILTKNKLLLFTDFGNYKVFQSAGIQTMIYMVKKEKALTKYPVKYSLLKNENLRKQDLPEFLDFDLSIKDAQKYLFEISPSANNEKAFTFNTNTDEEILNEIVAVANYRFSEKEVAQGMVFPQDFLNKANQKILGNSFEINEGIFGLTSKELELLDLNQKEKELIKPYFNTDNFNRYYGNPENTLWLIYTDSSFKNASSVLPYPNIKKHLDRFKNVITSDNKPYGLHRAREERFFKDEKIIAQRKCVGKPIFTYTNFDAYVSATFYVIKSFNDNHKFLTALLNSRLIEFWLRNKGKMQGNNFQLDKEPLLNIPIKTTENTKPFEKIAEYLIYLNDPKQESVLEKASNEAVSQVFEDLVNMMVYELYFADEMKAAAIDVLQFVTEKAFPDITEAKDKKAIIQKVYYELQQKDNPIRNRILVASSRSETIARINSTTS